jgi:WD40 repeat protein
MSYNWTRDQKLIIVGFVITCIVTIPPIFVQLATPELRRCLKLDIGNCPWFLSPASSQNSPEPSDLNPKKPSSPKTSTISWENPLKICEKTWDTQVPRGVVSQVSFDGYSLAYVDKVGVNVINLSTCQLRSTIPLERKVIAVALSSNGKLLTVTDNASRDIAIYDVDSNEKIKSIGGHKDLVFALTFSPDDRYLASMSKDKTVKLWNVQTGDAFLTSQHGFDYDYGTAIINFSSNSEYLVIPADGYYGSKSFLNTKTGVPLCSSNSRKYEFCNYGLSRGGLITDSNNNFFVTAFVDNSVKMWNINDGKEVRKFGGWFSGGHWHNPESMSLSDNRKILATGGSARDSNIKLWQVDTGKLIDTLVVENEISDVSKVSFTSEDRILFCIYRDRDKDQDKVRFWDLSNKKVIKTISLDRKDSHWISSFFSKDSKLLVFINHSSSSNSSEFSKLVVYKPS